MEKNNIPAPDFIIIDALKIRYRNSYYVGIVSTKYETSAVCFRCFRRISENNIYFYDRLRFFPPAVISRGKHIKIPVPACDLETVDALERAAAQEVRI